MKILLIGNANHQLLNNQYRDLKLHNSELTVDILNRKPFYKQNSANGYDKVINLYNSKLIDKIPFFRVHLRKWFIRKRLNAIKNNYDIIHIHYLDQNLITANRILKTFKGKIYITVWGSDFYRRSSQQRKNLLPLINLADNIFFPNRSTLEDFKTELNIKNNCSTLSFGLKPLDFLKNTTITTFDYKTLFDLEKADAYKFVTIGYSSRPQHQHLKIIESFISQKRLNNFKLFFIVPLAYGSGNIDYVRKIRDSLKKSGYKYKLLTDYLTDKQVAKLRKMTDIFIQLQTTDQLSGSMQEHIAAGNIVITGSWLPYHQLTSEGVHLEFVDNVSEVGNKLHSVLTRYEEIKPKCISSKDIIYNMSSLDSIRNQWMKIYRIS